MLVLVDSAMGSVCGRAYSMRGASVRAVSTPKPVPKALPKTRTGGRARQGPREKGLVCFPVL